VKPCICLIEDDLIMGEALVERFDMEGFSCDWFRNGNDAFLPLRNKLYALVVSDIRLPDISGEQIFTELRDTGASQPPFLFITGYGAIDQAVRLLKLGAEDYLTKPLDIPVLVAKVRVLASRSAASQEGTAMLGISRAMRNISAMLPRIAANARTVLITGESGVGKEVVARAIHDVARKGRPQPFIPVNCGAITESLMEAELFGHERGAFTGAIKERRGCFEQASGGTLFLDEIGEMPLSTQVKLLRAIQERCVVRVGGEKPIPVDIRLICASNRDLKAQIDAGKFREDLYYRVHVVQIDIPPLRERREDILWLADRFLDEFSTDGPRRRLDAAGEAALLAKPWPGNARELHHCLEGVCILSSSTVLSGDELCGWNGDVVVDEPQTSLAEHVAASERRHIAEVLAANGGRIADTAARLGISRKSLWEKMRKHDIKAAAADAE
jgi:DNA-binding NtrC family response regulator